MFCAIRVCVWIWSSCFSPFRRSHHYISPPPPLYPPPSPLPPHTLHETPRPCAVPLHLSGGASHLPRGEVHLHTGAQQGGLPGALVLPLQLHHLPSGVSDHVGCVYGHLLLHDRSTPDGLRLPDPRDLYGFARGKCVRDSGVGDRTRSAHGEVLASLGFGCRFLGWLRGWFGWRFGVA